MATMPSPTRPGPDLVRLGRHWGLVVGLGVISLVAGIVCLAVPAVASVTISVFLGWMLVLGGALQLGSAVANRAAGGLWTGPLLAAVWIVAGLWLVARPLEATITFTLLLVLFFVAIGVVRIAVGIQARREGVEAAGWVVVSGVLSVLVGVLVAVELPSSADWAIGLLAGIQFVFDGTGLIAAGLAARRLRG